LRRLWLDFMSVTAEAFRPHAEIGATRGRTILQAVPHGIETIILLNHHNQESIMKYLFVIAVVLLSACSTVQPTDPFAHLCPTQSSESCPGDTNTPIVLSGSRQARS